jgi:putative endopeptidase
MATSPLKAKPKTIRPANSLTPPIWIFRVKPGDNFFDYANGNWIKQNAIPAKETRWGSFNILRQDNTNRLLGLLNEVSKTPGQPKGSLKQRVGDLYASGMDSLTIEKKATPLSPPTCSASTK